MTDPGTTSYPGPGGMVMAAVLELKDSVVSLKGEVTQANATLGKLKVLIAPDPLNGDAPPGLMARVKALESLGAAIDAQMKAREARVKALESENATLKALLDPLKKAADDAEAWRRKIMVWVVGGVVAAVVTGAAGMLWVGFQASVGG